MLLEKLIQTTKVIAIGVLVVIGILTLSYSHAYGLVSAPFLPTHPGNQTEHFYVNGSGPGDDGNQYAFSFLKPEVYLDDCQDGYGDNGDDHGQGQSTVPEPTTLVLLGVGLAGVTLLKLRN